MSPSPSLKILPFQASITKPQPSFSNVKLLPSCAQLQLSAVMARYDRLIMVNPAGAIQIMAWADQMLQIYDA